MKFSTTAALSAAALLTGTVNADAQSVLSEASSSVATEAVESSTASAPELPTFTVRIPTSDSSPQNVIARLDDADFDVPLANYHQGRLPRAIH
jgi:hypothetical protein